LGVRVPPSALGTHYQRIRSSSNARQVSISVTQASTVGLVDASNLTVGDLVDDFARSLKAQRKAPKTVRAYTDAARKFAKWTEGTRRSSSVQAIAKADVEAFIIDQLEVHTPATAAAYYRHLQQFWRWVTAEGEIPVSPMAGMSPPKLPERPVPVFTPDELRALVKAAEGTTFEARRDTAMVHLFVATGVRLAEMAGMRLDSIARDEQAVLVIGKGDRARWVPYGDKAATALDRYLRVRRRHPRANLDALWVGQRGAVTASGITQMLRRLARRAGVQGVRPHRFRHTSAHRAQVAGITESDLMVVFGWRSPEMVRRYGSSARAERARAAFRRLDLEADL
jgi:site-specific recombinase XerD